MQQYFLCGARTGEHGCKYVNYYDRETVYNLFILCSGLPLIHNERAYEQVLNLISCDRCCGGWICSSF